MGHKKTEISHLNKKLKELDVEIQKKKQEKKRLLDIAVTSVWLDSEINEKSKEIILALESLEEERKQGEKDLKGFKAIQTNVEVLNQSGDEITKFAKFITDKVRNMSASEQRKLIKHFLQGEKIEITPRKSEKSIITNFGINKMRRVRIDWDYKLTGKLNISNLLGSLKTFEATGEVPSSYDVLKYSLRYGAGGHHGER